MKKKKWEFWIDRGGTFTDVVARSPEGQIFSDKLLSENSESYSNAAIQGIQNILKCTSIPSDEIAFIKMGTTVATNALLERRGAKVLLAITQGFGDALRIGYQNRPDLFALNIKLPSLLYDEVIEINERIDAKGTVLQSLDEKDALQKMKKAYARGYRTIAVVLMHAYQFTEHERKLKTIAQSVGFTQISISHEIAPVMKLVSRGDTTVVDAYLSPVLHGYIQGLRDQLSTIPLFFMQSNGGLIHAKLFQGKNSLFSGPAGGVIGMIKTSQLAGFNRVIGFDMGGTSTDVSHFAGEYERSFSYEFSGVHIRTPMMMIHTIAAGGGSILYFDGQRYAVGPQSAGANPGPACYRRGGPLTITDCNVMLGKIQPQFFPKVFGRRANQEIDVHVVHQNFQALVNKINDTTGSRKTIEEVAEGFLNIAVENMANAIKKISIQRGYDVRPYILNCFGGAAGQHACLVADNLGIEKILIHPLAGVLSAYGMGLAEISVLHEQVIEKPFQRGIISFLRSKFEKMERAARMELNSQGLENRETISKRQVHLRYEGSDTQLIVEFGTMKSMREAFIAQHHKTFGFSSYRKPLITESITIECSVPSEMDAECAEKIIQCRFEHKIPRRDTVKVFTHGSFRNAPVYIREELLSGDCIQGCAVITDNHSTTIVEPRWQAEVTSKKHLLLTRYQTVATKKVDTNVDPAMLEVFNNRFMNIAEQMGEVLRKTASSVNIKERLDFSCAIFDAHGELVANAPHIPVHLGSMSESVKSILKNNKKIHPNDVYALNAPYHGGTHLPDITLITPVFDKEGDHLLFIVGSRGHHADIGGITPGSIPAESRMVEEEGILINNFKIMDHGYFLEKATRNLLTQAQYPARNPQQNIEDFKAQIAANARGVQALLELVAQFGLDVVDAYMKHVRDNATLSVEHLLKHLKNGEFTYSLDDGSQIKVALTINKQKKRAKFDFTGSCAQHSGNFNAPTAICKAAVLYVLRCLIAENIPLNDGCFVPIELIIPEKSILKPNYPAAVVAGNVETSQCIVDTLFGALGVVAASQGTCNNFTFGNERYQYYETLCGGAGAGPDFDGASAVHTHMTNTYLTDPEILEWRFPVLLEEFALRKRSGGMGLHRGGDGVVRRIRFLEEMIVNIISSHRVIPPYGMQGGASGKLGHNWVQRVDGAIEELGGCARVEMHLGDVFVIETPGGGGYGKSR